MGKVHNEHVSKLRNSAGMIFKGRFRTSWINILSYATTLFVWIWAYMSYFDILGSIERKYVNAVIGFSAFFIHGVTLFLNWWFVISSANEILNQRTSRHDAVRLVSDRSEYSTAMKLMYVGHKTEIHVGVAALAIFVYCIYSIGYLAQNSPQGVADIDTVDGLVKTLPDTYNADSDKAYYTQRTDALLLFIASSLGFVTMLVPWGYYTYVASNFYANASKDFAGETRHDKRVDMRNAVHNSAFSAPAGPATLGKKLGPVV